MSGKSMPACLVPLNHSQHEACQLMTTHQCIKVRVKSCLVAVLSSRASWQSWNTTRHFCLCSCSELQVVEYPGYKSMTCNAVMSLTVQSGEVTKMGWGRVFLQEYKALLWFASPLLPTAGKHFRKIKPLCKIQPSLLSFSYCATVLKLPWLSVSLTTSGKEDVTILALPSSNTILFHVFHAERLLIHHKEKTKQNKQTQNNMQEFWLFL